MSVSDDAYMLGGFEPVRVRPAVKYDAQMNPVTRSGPGNVMRECIVDPVEATENNGEDYGRAGTVTRLRVTVNGPVPFEIHADDVVEIRGLEYEIEGTPEVWHDHDPRLAGPVFVVRRGVG